MRVCVCVCIWHITHQHLISARYLFLVLLEHQPENYETRKKKAVERHCLVSLSFCAALHTLACLGTLFSTRFGYQIVRIYPPL
jgi:hypothetical protein